LFYIFGRNINDSHYYYYILSYVSADEIYAKTPKAGKGARTPCYAIRLLSQVGLYI